MGAYQRSPSLSEAQLKWLEQHLPYTLKSMSSVVSNYDIPNRAADQAASSSQMLLRLVTRQRLFLGDDTVMSHILKRLVTVHSLFDSEWVQVLFTGGIRIPFTDPAGAPIVHCAPVTPCGPGMYTHGGQRISQDAVDVACLMTRILRRCLELCGPSVRMDMRTLRLASELFPAHASLTRTVMGVLEADLERRQAEDRAEFSSFKGIPRHRMHRLDLSTEYAQGVLGEDNPIVRVGYNSVQAYLDTYAHLERANFTCVMKSALENLQQGFVHDSGDMAMIERCWVNSILKTERQQRLELLVSIQPQRPVPPAMVEFGKLFLLSNDNFASYVACMSMGTRESHNQDAMFRRKPTDPPGEVVKHIPTRLGRERQMMQQYGPGHQVVLTPLPSFSSVSGPEMDVVLASDCCGAVFSDALMLAFQPVIEALKEIRDDDPPFAESLTGVDRTVHRPGYWTEGQTRVDMEFMYP
ncbi:hypothetical protein KIPB_006548, partial [Kipferlia bialata]|eukprot:g6548.t1